MTDKIATEWDAEQSRFAAKWRRNMEGHRQTLWLTPEQMAKINLDLANVPVGLWQRNRMQEDLHLVRAAIRTDSILLSLDDEARGLFAAAVTALPALGSIMWINPREEANPALWIDKGAPTQESRMLRNYAPGTV